MSQNLLELDHVTKLYPVGGFFSRQAIKAVNDVSFSLAADKPEIFAIVGESGSGKSTLAKMMLGNEVPNQGRLRVRRHRYRHASAPRRSAKPSWPRCSRCSRIPFEAFNPLTHVDEYLFATAHRFAGADTPPAAGAAIR